MPETLQFHELPAEQQRALKSGAQTGFFVQGDDLLRISSLNSDGAVVVTVVGRLLALDGQIRPFAFRHVPNTDRTIARTTFGLGDGWLLSASCVASGATPIIGQTWVKLDIVRGAGSNINELAALASGYVTAEQRIAWPGSKLHDTLSGRGAVRGVTGTNPAAGSQITEAVPTGARWRLLALRATLTTSIAAGARRPYLSISDGVAAVAVIPQAQTVAASSSLAFAWVAGIPFETAVGTRGQSGLPLETYLRAGFTFATVLDNGDAGDDWDAPEFLIEEWLEGS